MADEAKKDDFQAILDVAVPAAQAKAKVRFLRAHLARP
jgi:hypothetical protein